MTDIIRKRGDTYANERTVTSAKTGLPINITGYSFILTVDSMKNPSDELTKQFIINGTILDGPNGSVEFAPLLADVDKVGEYYYDIQMIDGAGRKRTIDEGSYIFTQDITKA